MGRRRRCKGAGAAAAQAAVRGPPLDQHPLRDVRFRSTTHVSSQEKSWTEPLRKNAVCSCHLLFAMFIRLTSPVTVMLLSCSCHLSCREHQISTDPQSVCRGVAAPVLARQSAAQPQLPTARPPTRRQAAAAALPVRASARASLSLERSRAVIRAWFEVICCQKLLDMHIQT